AGASEPVASADECRRTATLTLFSNEPMSTSEATTRNIKVQVKSQYDPSRSNPNQNQWFFLYTVRITNEGSETVQLISRHWVITDAMGKVQEVRGPGVVGR